MFVLKHKADLVPSGYKKSHRSSWGFGRSGMMLDSNHSGAIRKAMDMKSRLMVSLDMIKISNGILINSSITINQIIIIFILFPDFCMSTDAAVSAACLYGHEGAPGGLGVAGRRPVAEHHHPNATRERTHLLLHRQQFDR